MNVSDIIALIALVFSILSVIITLVTYIKGLRRERKYATLHAFNTLQEQVLDHLNPYTKKRVKEIAENPGSEEYKQLSGYLARLEHFSVGVNTRIYDIRVVRRLAGRYLCGLQGKIDPLIQKKRSINHLERHYNEFETMMKKIRRLYAMKENGHV